MSSFFFTNLPGALAIGSNCYSIETGGRRILLDAGYHPKKTGPDGLPRLDLVKDDSCDAIVLSHAHHDHIGSLPVVLRRHPRAGKGAVWVVRVFAGPLCPRASGLGGEMRPWGSGR